MRFDGLDLNLLVAFDTLVEHRSVSAAAEVMNLSQSAMSSALGRLRVFFEDDLLTPSGRGMTLTPKAEELLPAVRTALLHIKSTITNPASFDPALSRREFTIAASDYAQITLLDPFMRRMASSSPAMRFHLLPISQQSVEEFKRGLIDLMIVVEAVKLTDHPEQLLFEDEPRLICWNEHSDIRQAISMDQFLAAGHVTASLSNQKIGSHYDVLLERLSIERRIEVQVPAFCSIPGAVVGTDRLAVMHRRLAQYFADILPIRVLPLPFELPRVRELAQWHAQRGHDSGIKWLVAELEKEGAALR